MTPQAQDSFRERFDIHAKKKNSKEKQDSQLINLNLQDKSKNLLTKSFTRNFNLKYGRNTAENTRKLESIYANPSIKSNCYDSSSKKKLEYLKRIISSNNKGKQRIKKELNGEQTFIFLYRFVDKNYCNF